MRENRHSGAAARTDHSILGRDPEDVTGLLPQYVVGQTLEFVGEFQLVGVEKVFE
ncbi:MAG: hypothetical protein Cons2KO_01870 [Congregibacter sp.]